MRQREKFWVSSVLDPHALRYATVDLHRQSVNTRTSQRGVQNIKINIALNSREHKVFKKQ